MNIADDKYIELEDSHGRHGMMLRELYDTFKSFYFDMLEQHRQIKLMELFKIAEDTIGEADKYNLYWFLLKVKEDLVSKGLIQIAFDKYHNQLISLKKTSQSSLLRRGKKN